MKSTGYILNGKYYPGDSFDVDANRESRNSLDKQYSHDRQRDEHRRDLIQPYDIHGNPNPEFINEYPEESKQYGFIKE